MSCSICSSTHLHFETYSEIFITDSRAINQKQTNWKLKIGIGFSKISDMEFFIEYFVVELTFTTIVPLIKKLCIILKRCAFNNE